MCSHQINENITSKQSSHLARNAARNAVIEHQKSKRFRGEGIVLRHTCRGYGTAGKIGASEAIQKRLEWENLIFFAA